VRVSTTERKRLHSIARDYFTRQSGRTGRESPRRL